MSLEQKREHWSLNGINIQEQIDKNTENIDNNSRLVLYSRISIGINSKKLKIVKSFSI